MMLPIEVRAEPRGAAGAKEAISELGPPAKPRSPRIALYSHDTLGLGHARRNLLLAQTLAASALEPVTLAIVGKQAVGRFPLPRRGDRLVLPGLRKSSDGNYAPSSLDLPLQQVVELRSRTIRAALEAFQPDVLLVDNVPRGAQRELDESLAMLRARGDTRIVLGLRDVLDEPEAIRRQWNEANAYAVLRDCYDEIWVYGDPAIFDATQDYWFPDDVRPKIRFTGYFDLRERLRYAPKDELRWADQQIGGHGETIVCLVGGGEDGASLASAFSEIVLPEGLRALAVRGPHLPEATTRRLERRAERDAAFRTVEFVREPMALLRHCRAAITMGGYNSVWEAVSLEKPLLVAPRVAPRREQWIRASRLAELGLLDLLRPEQVTGGALSAWVAGLGSAPRARIRDVIPLDGLSRVVELVGALLEVRTRAVGS